MYNYPFKKEEEFVINEAADINCKFDEKKLFVNILLTNKNILVFYNTDKYNPLKSTGIQTMPEYELLFKVALNNMDYKIKNPDTLLYINNTVILYNFNIKDFIEKDD